MNEQSELERLRAVFEAGARALVVLRIDPELGPERTEAWALHERAMNAREALWPAMLAVCEAADEGGPEGDWLGSEALLDLTCTLDAAIREHLGEES